MIGNQPPKICPVCIKRDRRIAMYVVNLGRGRTRLVAIWACPVCRYEEVNIL